MASSLDPSAILADLVSRYMNLPLVQKILFPVLIVGSVMLIVMVSRWSSQPEYSHLFGSLSETDMAAVVDKLKEEKIEYKFGPSGDSILVTPPSIVHEMRMRLKSEGIPSGGSVGFEIFDADNLGLTNFGEKIKHLRALQGELSRTIGTIEGVRKARVHITQPEKSVFASKSQQATASVLLHMNSRQGLEKNQLMGIVSLVSGSVPGLVKENVSIVDQHGELLNPPEEDKDELFGGDTSRIQYQREVEKGYARRIEEILSKVIGTGRVIARVTADIDFSVNEREEESWDPSSQVVVSERTKTEGTGAEQRGGIPGVVSNLSSDPNLLQQPGSNFADTRSSETVKNYEVSRAVIKSSSPRGVLTRLSVAVLVDGNYSAITGADGTVTKDYEPLSEETLEQLESLAKSAVGFDAVRGDAITVENIQFKAPEILAAGALTESLDVDAIGYWTMNILFVFLVMFMVRKLVNFIITPDESEVNLERLLPQGIQDLEKELEVEKQRATVPDLETVVDLSQLEELIAENSRAVEENPQQAALLIRYWLNEGRL